ncbi:MAG: preprotein translocase subunit SecA, partial [Nitrospiraceae bacterium]
MLAHALNLIFGSKNDREINQLRPAVARINELEPSIAPLSTTALADKTAQFQKRIQDGETLDDLLPEAFAVCREASKRVLSMRHFDVQLLGGMVLHKG